MKNQLKFLIRIIIPCLIILTLLSSCDLDYLFGDGLGEKKYDGKLAVHFLDVGQGDSIFIELPNDETMLIDAGENYHGEGIINYIKKAGHSKIDYLVATHPHSDHIGSMPYIVRNFDIGSVYMPKVSANTDIYESLLKAVKNKKLKVNSGKAGVNIVKTDELSADIIAPVKIDESNLNNCSIVIKLSFGKKSFLLTGDAESSEMNTITAELKTDVLKAGHHGSKNSTNKKLLEKIAPEITVISCGKDNDYGHPHKEVLTQLKKINSSVYRTDKDKTVIVVTDGNGLTVSTDNESIKKAK